MLKEGVIDLEDRQRKTKISIIGVSEELIQDSGTKQIFEIIIKENFLGKKT